MSDPFETLKEKYMRPAPGFLFHPQVGSDCGINEMWDNVGNLKGISHHTLSICTVFQLYIFT